MRQVRGIRLARAAGQLPPAGRLPRGRPGPAPGAAGGQGPHASAVVHRAQHHHRLAGAEQAEHRRGTRLGPRRRRGRGDQENPALRPGRFVPGRAGRGGPRARRSRPGQARPRALGRAVRDVGRGPAGAQGAARPAHRARAARRVGLCAAGLRARRQGRGHPQGVRCGAERARPGAPRALGRVGRPRREQRHHDGGRAVVHPAGAPDQDVPRQHLRPHAALRHPRAHDGRGPERDRRRRPHPAVRRHVPGVQRLHAGGGPAGGAVQAPVDLHLDARLHRPRRRRPDPPAGRAPVGAARHSRP